MSVNQATTELDASALGQLADDLMHLGYWRVNLLEQTLHWSKRVFEIHRLNPEDYSPELDSAIEFYHPDDRDRVSHCVNQAIEKGKNFSFELRLLVADGSTRYVRSVAKCLFTSAGAVRGIEGVFEDITEWVLDSERYDQIKNIHQRYLDASNDGYWDWYVKEDYEYMSPRFWEMFGYDPAEKPHSPSAWQDIINQDDLQVALENFNEHVESRGEKPYVQEVRYRHKQGHTVTVLCRGSVVEWAEDGSPIRMVGTHTDITAQKKAEDELRKTLDFQQLLMTVNEDLIFVKDAQFRIVLANKAFMILYPKEQQDKIIGYTTLEEYPPEEAEAFLAEDRRAFRDGSSEVIEHISFPDGSRRSLLTKKTRFQSDDNETYILCVARDITRRIETEKKLQETNLELEEFAYRTSHDLRSPLVSSIRLLDITARILEKGDSEKALLHISVIQESLTKLETLVADLLALTKTSKTEAQYENTSLNESIQNTKDKLSHLSGFSDIEFIVDVNTNDQIFTDPLTLSVIFENLISNAVKYRDENKSSQFIKVSCENKKNSHVITISDNGIGIPVKYQTKLFNMFSRFHPKVSFGSGLGLYILKKAVEKIGGSVSFNTASEHTTFVVVLPKRG
jgi:PAS domain S-box-containing protein